MTPPSFGVSPMDSETDLVLELPTDVRTIEHAVDFIMEHCECCERKGEKLRLNFRVGLTEALSNAMLYGNGEDPDKRVRLELILDEKRITARVIDQGDGFDPEQVPDPTNPSNLEKPRGRGIFLMRQLLDEVRFNDRGNCVTLVLRSTSETGLDGGARA